MKSKWIKLKYRVPLTELVEDLLKHPINKTTDYGFDVSDVSETSINCSFYEKSIEKNAIHLPNGDVIETEDEKFTYFDFIITSTSKETALICIKNPPRSLRSFLDRVTEVLSEEVYFSNINIDLLGFVKDLHERLNITQLKVSEVIASDLVLDESSTAEVKIKSRGNAINTLENSFPESTYTVKNLVLRYVEKGKQFQLKASKRTSIDAPEQLLTSLTDLIVDSLE